MPGKRISMAGRKKTQQEEEHKLESTGGMRWLLTYADMITLLLGVFVILASIGSADMTKFMNIADQAADEFHAAKILPITGGTDKVLSGATGVMPYYIPTPPRVIEVKVEREGGEGVSVVETLAGTLITLSSGILFDSGSAELKPEAKKVVDEIYQQYLKNTKAAFIIKGHTDNQPISNIIFPSNWELSMSRAGSVARYLIRRWKIADYRITTAGYADTMPIASNLTNEGRMLNRRVEIMVLKDEDEVAVEKENIRELRAPIPDK